ncbi:MFS transporter [Oceanicoccus sp. KOV_DT_Chl]|uniref:spinster family MFS transporter n=1 Tax=Oceanicoccus sp. KOV_DT_Chl TaxID=1904639 RepID=UPI001F30995E|nr:MFS transporter [Oceanicoccus sp. KOV_DT_Chl]
MPHRQFSAPYRWYVLALLTLGYIFNFVDRQVMTILIEPIKDEFGATDTQMGLLSGFAFALFYASLGVPVARLADNWSRRNVLAISMSIWSVVTALCGLAGSFWQLALLRIGVGIGEAGGTPPSQSLISEYFPPEKRSLALGIYSIAPNLGIIVGLFGGAIIADAYGWRMVFFVFGLPGVLLAPILFFTLREPKRVVASVNRSGETLMSTIKQICAVPAFIYISLAVGFTAISGYGMGAWSPSFLVRVHGLSLVDAGLYLGLIGALCGGVGAVLGGLLCDKLSARNPVWQLRIPAIGVLISFPLQLAFVFWPEQSTVNVLGSQVPVAVLFSAVAAMFAGFWVGPTYAAVQNIVPPYWRAQASALLLLAFNLLGMGLGLY